MKKLLITTAALAVMSFSAIAEEFSLGFTIPSGSVISSSGEVMPAHETENGQRSLEQDGYLIAAGNIHIQVNDTLVTIPMEDVKGKNTQQVKEHIKNEVGSAVAISNLETSGVLDGLSEDATQQIINETIENVLSGAIDEVSEDVINAVGGEEAFTSALEAASEAAAQSELDWFNGLTEEQKNADTRPDGSAW